MATDYQRPGWFTKNVFNPIVAGLTRIGISLVGSRVLEVRGRKSGEWRRTPVNPLEFEGERYLVAARGQTQWVRNLRVSGEVRLRKGRRTEEFAATELAAPDRAAASRLPDLPTPIAPRAPVLADSAAPVRARLYVMPRDAPRHGMIAV